MEAEGVPAREEGRSRPMVPKDEPSLLCTEQECEAETPEYNVVTVSEHSDDLEASDSVQYTINPPDNPGPSNGQRHLNLVDVCRPLPDPSNACYGTYSTEPRQGPGFFTSEGQFQPVNLKMASALPLPRRSARCTTSYRVPTFMYDPGVEHQKMKTEAECLDETAAPCRKKSRTLYNIDQLQELERMFVEDHYPDSEKRKNIAEIVGVTPQRIMVWFQNRRAKWRKVEKTSHKVVKKPTSSMTMAPSTYSQSASLNTSSSVPTQPETVPYAMSSVQHPYGSFAGIRNGMAIAPGNLLPRSQSVDVSQHSTSCSSSSSGSVSTLGSPGSICASPSQQYPPMFHSPPPLRRVGLPMSMAFNTSNHMVPLMLDTPESTCTPSPSTEGDVFTFSVQESPVAETMAAPMRYGTQYYHQSNQMGHYQVPQYTQYQRVPVHSLTPTSPENTAFVTVPANNPGVMAYGNPGSFLQGRPASHILIQPGTVGGLAFHSSAWNNMYIQSAPFSCAHPQVDVTRTIPEQPLFSQPGPRILQHPQKITTPAQTTIEASASTEHVTREVTEA